MDQDGRIALVAVGISAHADAILQALTRDNLACEVVLTRDGVETLDYLFRRGAYTGRKTHVMPCVVLLDLSLPRLAGLDVLRQLRADERTKLLPVVAFSSSDERQGADIVNTVYASGANSYIGEPPGSESLVESLRHVAHYWLVLNEPPPTP